VQTMQGLGEFAFALSTNCIQMAQNGKEHAFQCMQESVPRAK